MPPTEAILPAAEAVAVVVVVVALLVILVGFGIPKRLAKSRLDILVTGG